MLTEPPGPDVVEVSIFGPGKGESIIVHLGNNRWIVVDSCIDQRLDGGPVALNYLERIGVDFSTSVRMIVVTHAHDDHFAGIADVFNACPDAIFVCSAALTGEEFLALIDVNVQTQLNVRKSAFSEYRKIFEAVESRSGSRPAFRPLRHAFELRELLTDTVDGYAQKVIALSPSDEALRRSLRALAGSLPAVGGRRKLSRIDPNELAVALWLEIGEKRVLLGADLLRGPAGCGWTAVLETFTADVKASVIKVPHHGSETSHHEGVWKELVQESPIALLTPFRAGRTVLPSREDVDRICSLTDRAYITAAPRTPSASRAVKREAASLGPLARNIREPWGQVGHVCARSRIGENEWTVTYSPRAEILSRRSTR